MYTAQVFFVTRKRGLNLFSICKSEICFGDIKLTESGLDAVSCEDNGPSLSFMSGTCPSFHSTLFFCFSLSSEIFKHLKMLLSPLLESYLKFNLAFDSLVLAYASIFPRKGLAASHHLLPLSPPHPCQSLKTDTNSTGK